MKLLEWLFGCRHRRLTRPLSMLDGRRVPCYVACLDCGREMRYQFPALERRQPARHGIQAATEEV